MSDKQNSFWDRLMWRLSGKPLVPVAPANQAPQAAAPAAVIARRESKAGPFDVVHVAGVQALAELKALAAQGRGYPVLVGTPEDLERVLGDHEHHEGNAPGNPLEGAAKLDALEWLRKRAEEDAEYYQEDHGPWPDEPTPSDEIQGHCDILKKRRPYPEVCILLLPVAHSWQVPLMLRYGNWNACPAAEEHAAVMRMWEQEYGAKVVTVSPDVIEMSVERPPQTREAAMALARQHFIYCADIVQQGTGTLEVLANTLLNGHVWYFWWD